MYHILSNRFEFYIEGQWGYFEQFSDSFSVLWSMLGDISKRLTVRNGGRWGSWSNDIGFCPEGRYAIGFEKKVRYDM